MSEADLKPLPDCRYCGTPLEWGKGNHEGVHMEVGCPKCWTSFERSTEEACWEVLNTRPAATPSHAKEDLGLGGDEICFTCGHPLGKHNEATLQCPTAIDKNGWNHGWLLTEFMSLPATQPATPSKPSEDAGRPVKKSLTAEAIEEIREVLKSKLGIPGGDTERMIDEACDYAALFDETDDLWQDLVQHHEEVEDAARELLLAMSLAGYFAQTQPFINKLEALLAKDNEDLKRDRLTALSASCGMEKVREIAEKAWREGFNSGRHEGEDGYFRLDEASIPVGHILALIPSSPDSGQGGGK